VIPNEDGTETETKLYPYITGQHGAESTFYCDDCAEEIPVKHHFYHCWVSQSLSTVLMSVYRLGMSRF
jgi:hypothetical protein